MSVVAIFLRVRYDTPASRATSGQFPFVAWSCSST